MMVATGLREVILVFLSFPLPTRAWRTSLGLALVACLQAQVPKLEKSESRPVTEAVAADPAMAKVLEPYVAEIRQHFDRPLVECPEGLFRGRGFAEENKLGYWVADEMRRKAEQLLGRGVKFALTNSGGLRTNIRPGTVKVAHIFEVMPFENELMVAEFTGAEVVQIVKDGLSRRAGEPMSGVIAKVMGTVEKPEVTITWEDGTPILPEEVVTVASTDYLLASGDGMSTIRQGRKATATGGRVRDVLLEACARLGKEKKPLPAPRAGRYVFASEALYQALRERKIKL